MLIDYGPKNVTLRYPTWRNGSVYVFPTKVSQGTQNESFASFFFGQYINYGHYHFPWGTSWDFKMITAEHLTERFKKQCVIDNRLPCWETIYPCRLPDQEY